MNLKALLVTPALVTGMLVSAQNQNWTATDIAGNTISIQDYLNEGKTVLVDISAHWCGPCWAWHNSGIMEKLYHEFGPEGTNDLVIIWVDGDPASSMALIEGATGSQGNWTVGVDYPIIGPDGEGSALADIYNISAYPTLFMHCPGSNAGVEINRTATWQQFFQSWRNGCASPFNNGTNDATLLADNSGTLCPGEHPSATLYNMGTANLSSAVIELIENGTTVQTINWTGNLARWASANVVFDQVDVVGTQEFTARVTMPNGVDDDHAPGADEEYFFEQAPEAASATVNFQIRTDSYCEETSWKLYNSNNQVVYQAGPYTATSQDNTTFNYWWNLNPTECYRLEVSDAYGDGICCTYGNGFYKVISNGVEVLNGGQFGALAKEPFAAGAAVGIEENVFEQGLNMFPNPTTGALTVNFDLSNAATVNFTVMNLLGETVLSTSKGFGAGAQQNVLDLSSLSNGSYMVNILADGMVATRKVTVNR